jgi:putative ABC transport system permease protein
LRSAFVILVLAVAGAIFISTLSLRGSLLLTIDGIVDYWQQDIRVLLRQPYRLSKVDRVALNLPEVAGVEGRITVDAFLLDPDGQESKRIVTVLGVPLNSQFTQPTLLAGRWLQPYDERAVVINVGVIQDSTTLSVGETLTLRINGKETSWHVVGLVTSQIIGNTDFMSSVAYTSYADLAQVMGQNGRISELLVSAHPEAGKSTAEIITALEEQYNLAGIQTYQIHSYLPMRRALNSLFAIPVSLTFLMTLLFAGVGGLGLMGMMSLNVMQRTREIAVVRTVGSTDMMVASLIISEGAVIGLFSWLFGIVLALPLSRFLSSAVGLAFLNAELTYIFPGRAILLCFFFILFLAILSSFLPARSAARLSIRNALNYE